MAVVAVVVVVESVANFIGSGSPVCWESGISCGCVVVGDVFLSEEDRGEVVIGPPE